MSNNPPSHKRKLSRASNVLTSTGQPAVKELGIITDERPLTTPVKKLSRHGFGGSIKRILQDVRDTATNALGRSKSLSAGKTVKPAWLDNADLSSSTSASADTSIRKGHARSRSDVQGVRPTLAKTTSAPAELKRTNTQPPMQILPSVAERSPPASPIVAPLQPPVVFDAESVQSPVEHEQPKFVGGDVAVPQLLQQGTPMTKVTNKKRKKVVFRLDADQGQIVWESKKHKISAWSYPVSVLLMLSCFYLQYPLKLLRRYGRGVMLGITVNNFSSPKSTKTAGSPLSTSLTETTRLCTSLPPPRTCSTCGTRLCVSSTRFGRSS